MTIPESVEQSPDKMLISNSFNPSHFLTDTVHNLVRKFLQLLFNLSTKGFDKYILLHWSFITTNSRFYINVTFHTTESSVALNLVPSLEPRGKCDRKEKDFAQSQTFPILKTCARTLL